ncbi:uncharacterized protein LOC108742214 [Agrilus planipennis]|uniref:Uncharacterized protein LOC108742214 n=1 Tax=Agrilus planipennis TaxID=224129 RepID=A0A1W4XK21_AGRPL|nr:uncharacterized protein LOC108742214 [Agrilus planipennis]
METENKENIDEAEEKSPSFKPWHVLYAVDTDASMFIRGNDSKTPFQKCLKALLYLADSSLLLTPRTMKSPLGVFLSENDIRKAKLIGFDQSMPENVKFLKSLIEKATDELQQLYERPGYFDFGDFLLFCKHQLDQLKTDPFKTTIVYITNVSNPVNDDEQLKIKVFNTVRNLEEQKVFLKIITMNPFFDVDDFYAELLNGLEIQKIQYVESDSDLEELLASLIKIKTVKISYKLYPFPGNEKKYFNLSSISYVRDNEIKNNVSVTKTDHAQVKKMFHHTKEIPPYVTVLNPGNKGLSPSVEFTKKEADALLKTNNLPVGLTLLYTCEKISNPYWFIKPVTIFQHNKMETNQYYIYLWNSLVKLELVMICYFKKRDNGKVHFVELEPKLVDNIQSFLCKYLPNAEEIKAHEPLDSVDIPKLAEQSMKDIIEKLSFDYDPKLFRNQIYEKKEKYIKSQLLEEDFVVDKQMENEALKSSKRIDEHIKEETEVLNNLFKKGTKRKN